MTRRSGRAIGVHIKPDSTTSCLLGVEETRCCACCGIFICQVAHADRTVGGRPAFRVRRVALTVEGACPKTPEWLACRAPGYRMAFQHQVGFGTLIPAEGVDALPHSSPIPAHGVVCSSSVPKRRATQTERGLHTREGHHSRVAAGREALQVQAFISSEWHCLKRPVAPTRRYADLVLSGAERAWPAAGLHRLASRRAQRRTAVAGRAVHETKSRRVASVVVAAWAFGLVGWPVTRRVAGCSSAGWQPGTSCESFFVPVRDE